MEDREMNVLRVSAGVIRDAAGRVLLCQRGYGAQAGQWEFPGGKCEKGETYEDCLIREICEELCVRIRCVRELVRMRYAYPDKVIDFAFIEAVIEEGELQALEHRAVKWTEPDEIEPQELCPADAEALERMRGLLTEDAQQNMLKEQRPQSMENE